MNTVNERLAQLHDQGFDQSYACERDDSGRFTKTIRVKCSQCEALCINGIATHENRCPNTPRDTDDCDDCEY
jgi:hypothetical protein